MLPYYLKWLCGLSKYTLLEGVWYDLTATVWDTQWSSLNFHTTVPLPTTFDFNPNPFVCLLNG